MYCKKKATVGISPLCAQVKAAMIDHGFGWTTWRRWTHLVLGNTQSSSRLKLPQSTTHLSLPLSRSPPLPRGPVHPHASLRQQRRLRLCNSGSPQPARRPHITQKAKARDDQVPAAAAAATDATGRVEGGETAVNCRRWMRGQAGREGRGERLCLRKGAERVTKEATVATEENRPRI